MPPSPLERLRRICLALPQAVEVPAWETSTFRCGKIFAMYAQPSDQKHSGGRPGVWLKAAPGNQELMLKADPDRFYFPPYVGPGGWIGVRLDRDPPWGEIALLVEESWRLIAPKKLVKARGSGSTPMSPPVKKAPRASARKSARTPARKRTRPPARKK